MNGRVDHHGHALVAVSVRASNVASAHEVVANDGDYPLLGVGLLVGLDLHISYRSGNITIE